MHRFALVLVVVAASPAFADDAKQQAAQLFEEGRQLDKDGKYAEACDKLAQSFALDAAPGTELNLGDCHEHLGHLAEAWHRFDHAAVQFEAAKDDRAKYARERRDALEPKLGVVVVKHPDPSAAVTIAGRAEPTTAAEIREHVDPGSIEIRVGTETKRVDVGAGATVRVDVAPVVATPTGGGVVGTTPVAGDTSPGPRSRTRVWLAVGAWGLGAVWLGGSFVIGSDANNDYKRATEGPIPECTSQSGKLVCTSDGYNTVNHSISLANEATGFAIVGIVLGAAGTYLFLTAPREHLTVAPTATASSAGVILSGSF
ncbi:MAG TPA: hypothetical protein VMJ10_08145 [Kofleriaceae bacterium]|nr:hypothetical protein [Kofleriaceae bacterium]